MKDQTIIWTGNQSEVPSEYEQYQKIDCSYLSVTPEIVDSHTHLVFGGDRSDEYAMRLNGADYQEIARAGGGILSTMNATNSLSRDELFELAVKRIEKINSFGVGTIEIKSGYGLNFEKEKEITLLINDLKNHFKNRVQIFNTFMAAHAVPKKFKSSKEFMESVVIPLLQELAPQKIIDAVDIFHEDGYFSEEDVKSLSAVAKKFNVPLKIHADEFIDNNGATIASEEKALSADHLLAISEKGIESLKNSNTVATLLPGTGYFLGKKQCDARKLLDNGVKVSIASDYNPGSCHQMNLLKIAVLSAPNYQMNISEVWASITLNAAHSLGMNDQGAIIPKMKARFSFWDTKI